MCVRDQSQPASQVPIRGKSLFSEHREKRQLYKIIIYLLSDDYVPVSVSLCSTNGCLSPSAAAASSILSLSSLTTSRSLGDPRSSRSGSRDSARGSSGLGVGTGDIVGTHPGEGARSVAMGSGEASVAGSVSIPALPFTRGSSLLAASSLAFSGSVGHWGALSWSLGDSAGLLAALGEAWAWGEIWAGESWPLNPGDGAFTGDWALAGDQEGGDWSLGGESAMGGVGGE